MTMEETSIHLTEFSGKESGWGGLSEKFLAWAKHKIFKMLLLVKGYQVGVNIIPTWDKYDFAVAGDYDQDKAVVTVGQLDKLAYKDNILSIFHKTKEGMWYLSL